MSQSSDERMTELRKLFFESAQELLQALNDEALKLEKKPGDGEIVRTIRRTVHTLKGDAAACGYEELSELAHEMEDALALETASAHASLAEVAFSAADIFGAILSAYRGGMKVPSTEPLRKMIRKLAQEPPTKEPSGMNSNKGRRNAVTKTKQSKRSGSRMAGSTIGEESKVQPGPRLPVAWNEYEQLAIRNAWDLGRNVYHVLVEIDLHCGMPIAGRQLVQSALSSLGEILATRPEPGSSEARRLLEFALATDKTADQIAAKCKIPTVVSKVDIEVFRSSPAPKDKTSPNPEPKAEVTSEPVAAAGDANAGALSAPEQQENGQEVQPQVAASTENTLRVDAERIDNVLNLVGELIIGKSMLEQTVHEFARRFPKEPLRGKFADAMAFQARVLNDLQRSVMKIRMVPVEQLFRRFPRIVRDVARHCGKQVELVISGQETDLDKSILDAIAEPITHLVRNAVSHGIENAPERQRIGKTAQGTICLKAYHQGNQVVVEVSDDGRGIDAERVKAKAIEQGMIGAAEAARLNEAEILDLIFRPGLSTAEEITEVSGRGVGMDVVHSVLQRLKGTVDVESHPGQGTAFQLKLPLTLAIIKALLFRVEHRLYAIPLNSVSEIARTVESQVHQVDNCEVLQLRNQVLPMLRLGRPATESAESGSRKLFVLVITGGEKKFGLIVDQLEGEEELVIKALDDHAISTDLFSGASIMGDGRVVLILNLAVVLEHFSRSRPSGTGIAASGMLLSHADRSRPAEPETRVQA